MAKFKIESGAQLLARLTKKIEIDKFYPILYENGLKYGDVVEISGNIGTAHLLNDIICEALYPAKENKEPAGVLMFNTAGNFIYEELMKTLRRKIYVNLDTNLGDQKIKAETERLLPKVLSNFYVLEIYDATQFCTTIYNIDSIFVKHSNISLLVFDTLTAFYWSEQGFKITKMDLYIKNLLRIIQTVCKEYKVIIIYTRPEYFSSSIDIDNLKTIVVTDCIKGDYSVNVKSLDCITKKYYNLVNNLIKWQ